MNSGFPVRPSLFVIRHSPSAVRRTGVIVTIALASLVLPNALTAGPPPDIVLRAMAQRCQMIDRIAPSVVCIFSPHKRGSGSGVLIDPDGYGLTNFHVIAGLLDTRRGLGGLGDGVLYELEVLGIDVTGDVAMFRLIPPQREFKFPYARLGDSDAACVGDPVIAMGNPFSLSEDYTPTVTHGIVTGIHRYQEGVRGNLIYTDCIQTDAPINPGSSGGPLFNEAGEVIGINGRISVNTRGRFNVGFGYAIASKQIRRFMPALRAGLLARHGTLQARVESDGPQNGLPQSIVFTEVWETGPAYEAGVRTGDRVLSLNDTAIQSANQVASILGTFPAYWPVLISFEHDGVPREVIVRLDPVKPRMQSPFETDSEVNLQAVHHVLRVFRQATLGSAAAERLHNWRWTVARQYHADTDGQPRAPESFDASQVGDGPVRMQQLHADGSAGRFVEYSAETATEHVTSGEPSSDLPPPVRMVLSALYTMQSRLLEPEHEIDLTDVVHVGAAALVEDPGSVDAVERSRAHHEIGTQLLEVLEWPLGNGTMARYAFDAESFLLARITVENPVSGTRAAIGLGNHRDVGGLVWPCTIKVQGDGFAYRDTLSGWELSP